MREQIRLHSQWWVSVSAADARRAATNGGWSPTELEMAGDPENHPQQIDLPGGWAYGFRPRTPSSLGVDYDKDAQADPRFVGVQTAADTKRLPSHFLSYARRVPIPPSWAGHTIFLHLNNARYHVTVVVNDRQVAQYVGGLEPHRLDVSEVIRPGEDNLILITVGDVGVSGHRPFDPFRFTGTRLPTCREIESNLVHPVRYGGSDGRGIEEAWLEAVPRVRVEYVFANPKVAQRLLRYRVAFANDTDVPVTVRVHSVARPSSDQTFRMPLLTAEGSSVAPESIAPRILLDEVVTLPPREGLTLTCDIPWANAVLWDTDQPFLYELATTLSSAEADGPLVRHEHRPDAGASDAGSLLDTQTDTFGFREFTINGHHFLLNGRVIHLHGQSGHVGPAQQAMTRAQKIEFLRIAKEEGHINHVRLHASPQDRRWVEAADRVGLLLTTETALWTTGFHSFDWAGSEEACYQNVRQHFFEALVRRDRNSPSVVIWSLSNEMSPITPWDLTEGPNAPKMADMTRVFRRILAEVAAEDDSRVVQMSSAMDFLGHLRMYNLHYPKNWQAYPDYPHTAYWLDKPFKFRWYGPGYAHMPSWSWRKDKPLYFGEYTCVFGPTPDVQSTIVGDIAFEEADFGTERVQEKLWPMEAKAYRRQDVSGFCAWAFLLGNDTDCRRLLDRPSAAAYVKAIRPLAVLDHGYQADTLAGAEVAIPLSLHNDTRHAVILELFCEAQWEDQVLGVDTMPARLMVPGETLAFVHRFLAPVVQAPARIRYRATLSADGAVVDQWEREIRVWPRQADLALPADVAFFDPDERVAAILAKRNLDGRSLIRELTRQTLSSVRALWMGFGAARAHTSDWRRFRETLHTFVRNGGVLILDQPPAAVLHDLPMPLNKAKGYAEPDQRLEITYAFPCAPFHPVMAGFQEEDFALWGDDFYIAHECLEIPQEGNVVPLLVAGTDRAGLVSSPLMEMRYGRGSYLISTMEILDKLDQSPVPARLLGALACYRPHWDVRTVGISVEDDLWRRLLEVGYVGDRRPPQETIGAEIAVLDGLAMEALNPACVREALMAGHTVCLHGLTPEQTRRVLSFLQLPGDVLPGTARPGEWDVVRHAHPLTDGMANNALYWVVHKAKLAPWAAASTHPEPASARVRLPELSSQAISLTRRGALTVYRVGSGTLVFDHLRWHMTDIEEPERPRRYGRCLMTNLGVPLLKGVEKQIGREFETEAERRERGHI